MIQKVSVIEWDKINDIFIIDLHKIFAYGFDFPIAKRNILRLIASICDPLRIMSKLSVLVKNYFQKLTNLRNNWNTGLNFEMTLKWLKLFNSLQSQISPYKDFIY